MKILRVSNSGIPLNWITPEEACIFSAKNLITWHIGDQIKIMRGGISRINNEQSTIDIFPVIASGNNSGKFKSPILTNPSLFRRDANTCMYCGVVFSDGHLTRDHVIPLSKNGPNTWNNSVAACKTCNQRKADRTPEKAKMPLLAVPYTPTHAEHLILINRTVLYDQMHFLSSYVKSDRMKMYIN
jgi:hypothetical protein